MLRSLIATAIVWLTLATTAQACLSTDLHRGVIFDAIPENAAADALVLRVDFDASDVRRIGGPHPTSAMREWLLMEVIAVDAQVIEVVRGQYNDTTVRVAIGGSSCDSPFIFGRRGLIIGRLVTPAEGQAQYDAATSDRPQPLRFVWPFNETVFDAMTETRGARENRTRQPAGERKSRGSATRRSR